jgi:hypothetical protein
LPVFNTRYAAAGCDVIRGRRYRASNIHPGSGQPVSSAPLQETAETDHAEIGMDRDEVAPGHTGVNGATLCQWNMYSGAPSTTAM